MARTLEEIRTDAGYKRARSFANAADIAPTTYARYEESPEMQDKMPLSAARRIARVAGCSVDELAGVDTVQKRLAALSERSREEALDFIAFLEQRDKRERSAAEERRRAVASGMVARLEGAFLERALADASFDIAGLKDAEAYRAAFEAWVRSRADSRPQAERFIRQVMDAFDRVHPGGTGGGVFELDLDGAFQD